MSLKSDWNFVKNAMRTPCNNGGFDIYIETGLAAAGIAALDIISFGCREPLKMALGRGQVKDWFGTRSRGINNPMSHRKPGVSGNRRAPSLKAGPSFFWHFEGLAERTLFYFMLFEVGKEAVMNWTSLMMAANGCDGPYAGYCEFNVTPQVIGTNRTDMLIAPLPNCHGVLSDIRHIYIPQGLTASISYHVNSQPWPPAPDPNARLSTFLFDSSDGKAWAASDQGGPGSGSNGTLGWQKNIPARTLGFRQISISAVTNQGLVWCPEGKLQVTLGGHEVKFFSPTDCFKDRADGAFDKWLQSLF